MPPHVRFPTAEKFLPSNLPQRSDAIQWTSKEVVHRLHAKDKPSILLELYVLTQCLRQTTQRAHLVPVHLNNEEATLLPLTWKYLTDDQIRAIRAKIQMATPPERYGEWLKWMISSLNVNELIGLFSGMKMAAPPQVLEKMKLLAEKNLERET